MPGSAPRQFPSRSLQGSRLRRKLSSLLVPAGGPVVVREVVSGNSGGTGGDVNLNTAAGTAVGDILVAFNLFDFGTASLMSSPSGSAGTWTLIDTADAGTNHCHLKAWWRPVTVGGAQTVTFTGSGSIDNIGFCYVLQGADAVYPLDASANNAALASGSQVAPTVTAVGPNDLLLCAWGSDPAGNYTVIPATMTDDGEQDSSSFCTMKTAHEKVVAPGATGTRTATFSNATGSYAAISVVILAAGLVGVRRMNSATISASGVTASAYTTTLGVTARAGDTLVVCGSSNGTHATNGMSVKDSVNNVNFTTILETQFGSASVRWLQTFAYTTTVDLPAATIITFTPYASNTSSAFALDIYRGATSTIAQAAVGSSNVSGTTSAAPALGAAPGAGTFVLTFCGDGSGTLSAGTVFTPGSTQTVGPSTGLGYLPVADGVSTYASTWTLGTANTSAAQTVALVQVVAAASSLPSPLDSAWQAGAVYWHLYNDITSRVGPPQQRIYSNILAGPASTDPLGMPAGAAADVAAYWDRRTTPQQRAYQSDPNLLVAAAADVPCLSVAYDVAAYVDRRGAFQQRPLLSEPSMLATSLLEGVQLGSADVARHNFAAMYVDRRQVPQQPIRDSDPNTLTSALLENELLGGAETLKRHLPAEYADRREVPAQRSYISDPSFYPSVSFDPLTVAFGASGHYWLLYNAPAILTDRRQVPQQRELESDPNTLTSALLENELLGGADDRRRHASTFSGRDSVISRPRYFDLSLLSPAGVDPLTLAAGVGGDLWRRYNAAASHQDRRETAFQPARRTLYFDAGPGLPPLALAWGAGGMLWHLYNRHSNDRAWWPGHFIGMVEGHSCTTLRVVTTLTVRPITGTTLRGTSGATSRLATGTTARPDTGVTEDPC